MTTTSNLHPGISVWSSGTFVVGQTCFTGTAGFNSGAVYRCIIGGSSTSAPTGTGSVINNGGTAYFTWLSTYDYPTFAAWVADTTHFPTTLTQPVVLLIWNDSQPTLTTTTGSAVFTLSGHTTSSTNTITIMPAPGEGFRDTLDANPNTPLAYNTANGVSVQLPASGAGFVIYCDIQDANVFIIGIQFQDPNSTSTAALIGAESGASGCVIADCIVDGYSQASNPLFKVNISSGSFSLINCLIIDRAPASNSGQSVVWLSVVPSPVVVNCTIIAINTTNTGAAIHFEFNNGIVRNCILIGYGTTSINTNSASVTADHCLSSAASFSDAGVTTGTGNLFSKTAANQFIASGTDYHLKPGADAINAGVTDLTDIPNGDSIDKTLRPAGTSWCIGCDEFSPFRSFLLNTTGVQIWDH